MENEPELAIFEKKVLLTLKKVPRGKVTTYSKLAKAIGRPNAVRAVGNALHKNRNAPVVPCHRVIKSNGQVGGYAQGTNKKIMLLKEENIVIKNRRVENFRKAIYNFIFTNNL